ncbi:MAG TPA: metabolite traffic protein EboE [Polyangiaceae bacterium]|nr:metabolite traffic protein EboE [Polyangiaceae bacterium]
MRVTPIAGAHLTYCSNVHPGESLAEVEGAIERHVVAVKRELSPAEPFGAGLRLSARAADELAGAERLARFASALQDAGLYVFTLNGFPHGAFHGTRVKEQVYRPDWLEAERVRYTAVLARVLARLLPDGVPGSISTVPGCFRPRGAESGVARQIAHNIARAAADLVQVERETGKFIALAIEPEPHCLLETTAEAITFFEEELLSREVQERSGLDEATLRRTVGVCLDTCHASVEFEEPLAAFQSLLRAGVAVPKIQISAGLRLAPATAERRQALAAFHNEVYFHQTVVRDGARLIRFLDLPEALASNLPESSEWRVHFHVPIFHDALDTFSSTQSDLVPLLAALRDAPSCPHLEVETYTWDVLPERFRDVPLTDAIARELRWTLSALGSP